MDLAKIDRLRRASVTKSYLPEKDVGWGVPYGSAHPALPSEVVSLRDLPEYAALDAAGRDALARHELASMFSTFVRFEAVINAYLARYAQKCASDDPLLPYALHVVEEEARHSRMFARAVDELGTGPYPRRGLFGRAEALGAALIWTSPSLFFLGVLAVEDVTDLVMAAALEHPELHPTVAEVSRIHRVEESRHMEFMREVILERYTRAGAVERAAMRVAAPMLALLVFTLLVSPRVYERSGVAGGTWASWRLWMRATRSPSRARLRASSVARMRRWLDQHGLVEGIASRIWAWAG
ncbi:MAG: diiron oxygenase [Myxococcales bacterium]|nr:diiron oxygenase [Myxococcales bacterium]